MPLLEIKEAIYGADVINIVTGLSFSIKTEIHSLQPKIAIFYAADFRIDISLTTDSRYYCETYAGVI